MTPAKPLFSRAFFVSLLAVLISSLAFGQAQPTHKPQTHPAPLGLEGNWDGPLQAGDAVLHLVLHVSKSPDGSFTATIDSLDQGVYGIEVSSLTLSSSVLRFSIPSVGATYGGKFSLDHRTIDGIWTQGLNSLPLAFQRQPIKAAANKRSDAISPSDGLLQAPLEGIGMLLRLQLHFSHDDQ